MTSRVQPGRDEVTECCCRASGPGQEEDRPVSSLAAKPNGALSRFDRLPRMTFEEDAGAEKSTACSGPSPTACNAWHKLRSLEQGRKRSLKAASIPQDVITILSDDEEELVPPAKMQEQ
ncbi:hypothetical protein MRX96_021583 [Rhipicephalus microplus]